MFVLLLAEPKKKAVSDEVGTVVPDQLFVVDQSALAPRPVHARVPVSGKVPSSVLDSVVEKGPPRDAGTRS